MTSYDEAVLQFIKEAAGDPHGISQGAMTSIYTVREHSRDFEMKSQVENVIRRIILKGGRYILQEFVSGSGGGHAPGSSPGGPSERPDDG